LAKSNKRVQSDLTASYANDSEWKKAAMLVGIQRRRLLALVVDGVKIGLAMANKKT